MDETTKRRLVGIGVISLIVLIVAWWLPDRDDGQTRLNPDRLPTETRVYDIHALDHPRQRGDDGAPLDEPLEDEPQDVEPALPPNIDPGFGQLGRATDAPKQTRDDKPDEAATAPSSEQKTAKAPSSDSTTARPDVKENEQSVKSAEPQKQVPVESVEPDKPAPSKPLPSGGWVVQVGSYGNQANADAMRKKLEARGYRVIVTSGQVNNKTFHRVRVGPYPQKSDASGAAQSLEKMLNQKVSVIRNS